MNVEDMVRKIEAVLLVMAAGGCAHVHEPQPCQCTCKAPAPIVSFEGGVTNIYGFSSDDYETTVLPVYGSTIDWPALDKAIDEAVEETDRQLEE